MSEYARAFRRFLEEHRRLLLRNGGDAIDGELINLSVLRMQFMELLPRSHNATLAYKAGVITAKFTAIWAAKFARAIYDDARKRGVLP